MLRSLSIILPFSVSLLLLIPASSLRVALGKQIPPSHIEEKPILLPKPALVRLTTLGYDSAVSDVLWFLTVNYFGKSFRNRGDFRWLHHYCSLTTELNPKITERYDFCATLLSWMAKNPLASNELLDRAITANPNSWRLRYLRSFNNWFFLHNPESGAEDLKVAATLPGAPPSISSLASRLISSSGDPQLAVDYLEEALLRTESEAARSALSLKLRQAILSRDIKHLNTLVKKFSEEQKRLPLHLEELIATGYLEELPIEPFGGSYILHSASKKVLSTSGKKGLELPRKE
jgi:hypothetical protein